MTAAVLGWTFFAVGKIRRKTSGLQNFKEALVEQVEIRFDGENFFSLIAEVDIGFRSEVKCDAERNCLLSTQSSARASLCPFDINSRAAFSDLLEAKIDWASVKKLFIVLVQKLIWYLVKSD